MNSEADVAARVAQNIPREQPVAPTSHEAPVKPTYGQEGYAFTNPLDELSMYKLYDYFNVPINDRSSPDTNKMMEKLIEWAVAKGAVEYHDVIKSVRDIQRFIASDSIKNLYAFAKLDMQRQNIEKEMSNLYES